jgi:hypothetical protein
MKFIKKFFSAVNRTLKTIIVFLLQTILLNFMLTVIYFLIFPFFKIFYIFEFSKKKINSEFIENKDYNITEEKNLTEGS